jgi:hypothetical protein
MPPLKEHRERYTIAVPARQAAVVDQADVLVVGGGPAGIGAALGAAAAGARVILAERYGFLGGSATAALVIPMMSFHTQSPVPRPAPTRLMPNDHGPGEPVTAGVVQTLIEKLIQAGGAIPPSLETGYVVPFDPEIFKSVVLDMLDEAGVPYLLHAFATDVVQNASTPGVVFATKSGPVAILARVLVDTTGDGDIAASAGAAFEIGEQLRGFVQPMTLMFRMVEFQYEPFDRYVQEHPGQWHGVHGLWDLAKQAAAAGELDLAREDMLLFATPHEQEVVVNSTRVVQVLGTNVWDLTYAEWEGRRQMRQIAAFLQRYVPGFEQAYVAQSGVQIGVRETRRIIGAYQLTADDILNARKFDDAIARGSYPLDIHNPTGKGTLLQRLPPGESYDIPLRTLIPRNVDHLLVAGRCISGTHEANSSYRTMPTSLATGQAAGVCAALAARTGTTPRNVPAAHVQAELLRQGANLGPRASAHIVQTGPATSV